MSMQPKGIEPDRHPTDMRGTNELPHIESVLSRGGDRVPIVPWVPVHLVGEGLHALL